MKNIRHILIAAICAFAVVPAVADESRDIVQEVVDQQPEISVKSGGIDIVVSGSTNADVTVYAITGQIVKHLQITEGTNHIELAAGCYIVRVGRLSKRVVVK